MSGKRIRADPTIRRGTVRQHRSAGYDVLAAGSGDKGLDQVRERPAALILLDDDLPGMTGLEVCRRIRARSELRDSVGRKPGDRGAA